MTIKCEVPRLRAVTVLALLRLVKIIFTVVGCLVMDGCLQPHRLYLYPVCFYQEAPTQQHLQDYYSPRFAGVVQTAIKDSSHSKITVTPDGRWLVASLTKTQKAKISAVWPRVGCIGDAVDSLSTKLESDCVAYQKQFVLTGNYFGFGNAKDAGGFDIWNESPVQNTLVRCYRAKKSGE